MVVLVKIFLAIFSLNCFATEDNRGWLGLFGKHLSSTNTHYTHQEVQLRYNFDEGNNQQLLARFGVLKSISNSQELGLLLAYVETGELKEYRPTLQHHYFYINPNWSLNVRSRIEWRDWEDRQTNSIRTRFQISYLQKINANSRLHLWDEPFINITSDNMSGERVFERNRAFIGIRFPYQGHQIELGYLNQFIARSKDLAEHIAVMYLYF